MGLLFIYDGIATSVYFIINGEFKSVIQICMKNGLKTLTFFDQDKWVIESGLKGLNVIINSFILLQYTVSGRWIICCIGLFILIFTLIIDYYFDIEPNFSSSNPKTPHDISFITLLGQITLIAVFSPILWGTLAGTIIFIISYFH